MEEGLHNSLDDEVDLPAQRINDMLKSALGPSAHWLYEDSVTEIWVNPDSKIWIDEIGKGRRWTGDLLPAELAERVIFTVSGSIKDSCTTVDPDIGAELPTLGFRFQGLLPPLVEKPVFNIRKSNSKKIPLPEYVESGYMPKSWAEIIRQAVLDRKNFFIVGSTGSGKTTLARTILLEIAKTKDRVVTIEDTRELNNPAEDGVSIKTRPPQRDMNACLQMTMRLYPGRIVIGEVRGPEALVLIKAWNTGHNGGVATAHANSAKRGLLRLEQLIEEAGVRPSRSAIAEAVNYVIYMENRRPIEMVEVEYDGHEYVFNPCS